MDNIAFRDDGGYANAMAVQTSATYPGSILIAVNSEVIRISANDVKRLLNWLQAADAETLKKWQEDA